MIGATSNAALSGMRTWQLRQDISANDIANVNTKGYSQKIPVQTEARPGSQISAFETEANGTPELSNTDLATELVEQKLSVSGYGANAKVLKVQDRMTQTLIDMIA